MIPVRCVTCGKVLGHLEPSWIRYKRELGPQAALDRLGLKRMCCRRHLLTYRDIVQQTLDYELANSLKAPNDNSADYITIHTAKPGAFEDTDAESTGSKVDSASSEQATGGDRRIVTYEGKISLELPNGKRRLLAR
jgi:DNA-directed RNA polymerase I, II, and III subunit RPABC5